MLYKDLIDLGFKRDDCLQNDSIWFDQHGYECFFLEKEIFKNTIIQWYPNNVDKLELIVYCKKNINVLSRREITVEEMMVLIKVMGREGDLPKPTHHPYSHAC